jgi:hypothetical protein
MHTSKNTLFIRLILFIFGFSMIFSVYVFTQKKSSSGNVGEASEIVKMSNSDLQKYKNDGLLIKKEQHCRISQRRNDRKLKEIF